MKKTFYAIAISFIMVLFSCKSTIITQHATTEQLTRLEPGMNKDQALTVFTGMFPYDIMMGADEGCEIHVYKYWKPSRKMLRANVQLEAYLSSGKKMYVKEADAFVYYKDGKIVLVSTEGNKGKYFNLLETRANDLKACAGPVKGCTDPTSLTYNPDATQDDGTCTYCECGMVANRDFDSKRALSDCNRPYLPLDENGNPIITVELDENGNPIAVIPPSEGSELMNTIIDRAMDDAVINPINSDEELDNIEDKLGKEEEEDLGDDVPPVE